MLNLLSDSLWEFYWISRYFMQLFINYKEQEAPLLQRALSMRAFRSPNNLVTDGETNRHCMLPDMTQWEGHIHLWYSYQNNKNVFMNLFMRK